MLVFSIYKITISFEERFLCITILIITLSFMYKFQLILLYIYHGIYSITDFCQDGDVRLVGGQSAYEGRVEVCLSQRWGTVTDDGWSKAYVQVVCRQLGYNSLGIYKF